MKGKTINCLNHGFVTLVDVMGDDLAVVEAARISTEAKTKQEDQQLINHLMRNRHSTPFEMVEFKFHCKMPIFIARQWVRHRTANINEFSMRYRAAPPEFYVPEPAQVKRQSKSNKQGRSDEPLTQGVINNFTNCTRQTAECALHNYGEHTSEEQDIAKELARINLPLTMYTEWYWKIDLHNLLHFLGLRMEHHAQYEIRVYANAIAELIKDLVPQSWAAFEEYRLNAMTFSKKELRELAYLLPLDKMEPSQLPPTGFSKGEWKEFIDKLMSLKP